MIPNQNSCVHAFVRLATSGLLLLGTAAAAGPALLIDFEAPDYDADPDGLPITGQQGWYIPNVDGSLDAYVFTYDGNALGVPTNAYGDAQFLAGNTPDLDGMFPRAQLDFDWSASTAWTVSYNITSGFNGDLPASDNLSSFSLQDSTTERYFIAVNTWSDTFFANHWDAGYIVFDQFGVIDDFPRSPGAAWRNLEVGHWYAQSTTFDFDSNTIQSVSITDLDTGDSTTFEPNGWYLAGGAVGRPPLPHALRFFVGGGGAASVPGNIGAFDNLEIDAVAVPSAPNKSNSQSIERAGGTKGAVTN